MHRTGRSANMLSRPSNDRNSACLNLSELQQGHSRLIQSRRGIQATPDLKSSSELLLAA
jgi:hypothetical protein